MSKPFKLKYNNSTFPFKTKDKEIIENIRYMPGDSDWDSTTPRDVDIIKQHKLNRGEDNQETTEDKNIDRLV